MKNTMSSKTEIIEFHIMVREKFSRLLKLKQERNQIGFYELMEKVMPEVKQYMNRQLKIAIQNNSLPEGKYKVEDFIDELYIEAYDNINDVKYSSQFHAWLFEKADELLDETIVEEDFDNFFFKNIDNFTKEEWEAMEEKFSRDGDGDLVMLEELDDDSLPKIEYQLVDVFIENEEEEWLKKLSEKLTEKEFQKQIEATLSLLPFHLRTVFELSVNQQFDAEEIAAIKKITIREVKDILTKSKNIIRKRLAIKHLKD